MFSTLSPSHLPAGVNHKIGAFQDISGVLSIFVEVAMIVFNAFPLVVILKWRPPEKRLVMDELIVALSITDILSVVIPTPVGLFSYFSDSWYGGKPACEFYQVTTIWLQLVGMFIVTSLCIDRLRALSANLVTFPAPATFAKRHRVRLGIFGIYVISFAVSSLPLMELAPSAMQSHGQICKAWISTPSNGRQESVFYVVFLVVGYGNFVIASAVSSRILCILWSDTSNKAIQNPDPTNNDTLRKAQLHTERATLIALSWMIIVILVLFYLTWFPALLMITFQKAGHQISDVAILYALLSTSLSGLMNPLIYGLFSKFYRSGYRRIILGIYDIFCGCCRKEFQSIPVTMKTRRTVWTFSRSELPATETEPSLRRSKSTITEGERSCDGEYDNPCFETSSCHSFGRDTEPLTKESPKPKRIRIVNPSLWQFPEQIPSQRQDVEDDKNEEDRLTESPSYNSSDAESNFSKTSIELSSDDTEDDDDEDDDLAADEVLVIEESVM